MIQSGSLHDCGGVNFVIFLFFIFDKEIKNRICHVFMNKVELFMYDNEYEIDSDEKMELVSKSTCSVYNCEFVVFVKN
jgi:hypothetical protein